MDAREHGYLGRPSKHEPGTRRVRAAILVSLGGALGCAPVSTQPELSDNDPSAGGRGTQTLPDPMQVDAGESSDAAPRQSEPADMDAATNPVPTPRADATGFCAALPRLGQPPTLDGAIEPGLTLEHVTPQGWTEGPPAGNSTRFVAAWIPSGLYFFLEVTDTELNPAPTDAPIWQGDSVEVYVDHDGVLAASGYDLEGTKQFMMGAPIQGQTDPVRADVYMAGNRERSWSASQCVGVTTAAGYAVELLVTAPDLDLESWSLEAGDHVGFDLAHSVSHPLGIAGTDGNRLGQYFLRVADPSSGSIADYPWVNSSVFCVPRLD